MDSDNPDSIDQSRLQTLRALQRTGRPNLLTHLFELYVSGTPKLTEEMRGAIARRDRSTLRVAAHTLKSSSANMGANSFAEKARQIEIDAETADWSDLQPQVDALAQDLPAVFDALRKAIDGSG